MADFIAQIKPRKSSVSGESPLSTELDVAEIAVNTADAKLFVKHTDGSIKEIGISKAELQAEVAASTSFADFQSRIAAL
jgi:hypothetical protein